MCVYIYIYVCVCEINAPHTLLSVGLKSCLELLYGLIPYGLCVYVCVYAYVCVYGCAFAYTRLCVHVYFVLYKFVFYNNICIYTSFSVCVNTPMCYEFIYIHLFVCNTHIIYIYVYIYINVCGCMSMST
eukprot:GHVR01003559.1.p1 GENE.GHVR01003559.1~~GHVR01003559.1.p1  ORF type:complete len:129 (-),score=33.10 GHVR01003559.1:47-433(-)